MDSKVEKMLAKNQPVSHILMQMEDFLDNLDLYVFKNWIDGVVVEGPTVEKYWVSFVLEFPYDMLPDPMGATRLIKHGAEVSFRKSFREEPIEVKKSSDYRQDRYGKPKMIKRKIWLFNITIPRKFIDDPITSNDETEST